MRILIVEDNEDSRNLLMKQLRAYGHEVAAAANGAEALQQALVQSPDIIVSDIMMPKMDGYQLCYEWKQNDKLKDIPLIFYTATYTSDEDEKFALSLGANTFIRKPTEPDILVQILCDVFEKAKAGALAPAEFVPLEPSLYLTEYNKRLISKLDKKVAQLQESEEKIKYIDSILRAIRSINQLIVREKDRAKVLNGACEILIKVREYRFAWIGLVEEGHKRVLPVAQAGFEEGYLDSVKITWDDTATGKGPTGTAIKTKQPSLMRNIPEDPRFEPWRAEALKRGYLSLVAVPLVHNEKVYGALCVYSSERDGFDDEETGLLVEVSGDLAFALKAIDDEEKHQWAEEALKESEQRFRAIFDNATDGILLADTEAKKFYTGNKMICQMLGYSLEEIKNLGVMDIHPENDLPYVIEQFEKQTKGEFMLAKDIPVKRKDGSVFYAEINSSSLTVAGKTYLMGIFRDITERKQAEEKIKQTAEEWSTTFNSITDFVAICDKDFRVVRVNKAFADLLKKKPDELIGKPCYEMVHGTNEPVLNCPHKKTMKTILKYLRRPYLMRKARLSPVFMLPEISPRP